MLSGNGRHRRPRQAPALLVAAGVTGSAIAIPLVAASGANAADGTTWDKVAQCETGGSWSADNGNGYYGGLLLTQDDWEKYGGLSYAASPDQASRSQQIAVAEKILADRGAGAWHTCGLLSGLTKSSGAAKVDTGVGGDSVPSSSKKAGGNGSAKSSGSTDSSDASGTSDASDSSDDGTDPGQSDSPGGTSDPADPSGSPAGASDAPRASKSPGSANRSDGSTAAEPSTAPSSPAKGGETVGSDASHGTGTTGTSPSRSAGSGGQDDYDRSDNSVQSVGSSALVDTGALGGGRHRGGSAAETPADSRTTAAGGRHASRGDAASYTVRSGDSLASIADSLDVSGGWHALYDANKSAVGADPNHIVAGQSLDVPTENAHK
ncbi:transglycosylase family protein [Streptomyces sp. NPDC015220]|uniref:LysM peptidoglycan-binding domain-containing protein n=1 Tax=Streptomyces sp. NPDC015220 TaxID=3364947 RepID=UPI0036F798D2